MNRVRVIDTSLHGQTERRTRRRALAVHIGGAVAMAVGSIVAFGAAFVVGFGNTYCGAEPEPHQIHDLRVGLAVIVIAYAMIPLVTAIAACALRVRSYVWFALAALVLLMFLPSALSAAPSQVRILNRHG